jgi:hypothetical protein
LLAGCASAPPAAKVATADRPSSAPTTTAAPTDYDKALAYTRCMTRNGVSTPDPVVGQVLVTVNIVHHGDTLEMLTAKKEAFARCKRLLPATWPQRVDPKEEVRTRKFVACVRQHGVDWPATDANGMADWPTDPGAMSTPEYDAAIRACRHLVDDPANSLPENR